MESSKRSRNWCGNTKINMSAPLTASTALGTATMFDGSSNPGRYFTFSWVVLMISVNGFPSTISSWTHILTVFSKSGCLRAFCAMIRAMAVPQFPEPRTVTPKAVELRTRGTTMSVRLSGGSSRDKTRCTFVMKGNSISTWWTLMNATVSASMRGPVGAAPSSTLRQAAAALSQLSDGDFANSCAQRRFRELPKLETIKSVQPQASWRAADAEICG
mmetsp:Transcript_78288/g.217432  ORF Transcript_78288/g.217432 Transcript_78288/m.217432 type:complete len:216 (-) Transcript_78288:1423-2070(-)